ncbi:MAG: hypothetical protein GY820_32040 [Gammaproteobacteria bacterium]|nr:hypothetical protein [Gammaproteobacteria bacterium]
MVGGGREVPPFPIELWNVNARTIEGKERTTNKIEGWHRCFQSQVGNLYPKFFKFVDVLKRENNLNQLEVAQMVAGNPLPPQRRKYRELSRRILVSARFILTIY